MKRTTAYVPTVKIRPHLSSHARKRAAILATRSRCEAGKRLAKSIDGHRCEHLATDIMPTGVPDVLATRLDDGTDLAVCERCRVLMVADPTASILAGVQHIVRPH